MADSIGVSTGKTMLRWGLILLKYTVFLVVVIGKAIYNKIKAYNENKASNKASTK